MIMRRLRDVRNHTLAVAALLMVSACGPVGDAEPVVSSTPAAELGWTAQVLDAVSGVDVPLQVTAEGDQAVVLVVADDGRVSGFATGRDGRFRPGTPVETGIAYLYLAEPVRSADEWLAAGSGALDSATAKRTRCGYCARRTGARGRRPT
ncbi:MAG: hypothetical protein KY460_11725 [Actinobacteria bacterium]|nr:hypothetical protein [Actinomycetota bacterium]